MTPLRVACIGAGYFSQFHTNSWARLADVRCVGMCDRDVKAAQATEWPAFQDLGKMLAVTQPDILDIILPPAAQADALETAIAHGVQTIICQKPFCTNLQEARRMTDAAEHAGVTLIIHENFRFQPWYRRLKKVLDQHICGQVHQMTFRLRPGDGQGPEAYLARQPYFQQMQRFLVHETGVHWIDTFRYLFGKPRSVYADLRRLNSHIAGEDAGFLLFEHDGGVRCLLDGNRHLDHAADNTRRTMGEALVEGTKGAITLGGDGALWLRAHGSQDETCLLAPNTADGFGGDCVHALQSHVHSALRTGTPLENTARDYLQVIEIEEAVYRSAQEARKVTL